MDHHHHHHHQQQLQQQQQQQFQQQQQLQLQQQQQAQLPPHSENVEEELQRIQFALKAVFSATPPPGQEAGNDTNNNNKNWYQERHLADRYLTSFQGTTVSWMVCDRLLLLDEQLQLQNVIVDGGPETAYRQQCRFFAAQTLHTKCRTGVHQLPYSSLPSLRDSLLKHLHRYTVGVPAEASSGGNDGGGGGGEIVYITNNNSALTTRLALCVSALAVQMEWTTILDDLLSSHQSKQQQQQHSNPLHPAAVGSSSLPNSSSTNTTTLATPDNMADRVLLLLILRVLPEECASDRLLLDDDGKRFRMRDHLVAKASHVFFFLQETLNLTSSLVSSSSSSTSTAAALSNDPAAAGVPSLHAQKQQQQLCARVFEAFHTWVRWVPVHPQSLVETPMLQTCVHALKQHSYLLEPAADVVVEVLRMYPSHVIVNESLVQLMIPLLSQLPLDQALQSQDEDVWRAYCRVVTEMGESYMSVILNSAHCYQQASQLVEWVLKCSGQIRDPDIASITLHFWYRMVLDLEAVDPYDYRQELIDAYTPHLLSLIDVCAVFLMRFPSDLTEDDDDRLDDLHRHRFYVSETVEDCCRLLGGHIVLKRMGELLRNQVQKVAAAAGSAAGGGQAVSQEWQGIESCLSCIAAIHRFVPSDEADVLPFVFQLIPQLPTTVGPLRFTASKTIGKFSSWLAMHSDYLQPLLPYLASGLSISECAPAAAVAIKELCECSNQRFAIAEPVLQLYQEIALSQPGRLELADELQILEGVCRALSRQIQDRREDGTAFLARLAQPIGTQLAAAVNDPAASPRRILPGIERLTIVIQFLKVPQTPNAPIHPLVDLMSSTWSLLETATHRFPHDNLLAEKICRLHKHALRSVGAKSYSIALDPLMQQLVQSYEQTHQSPFLYAASICITEYGHDALFSKKLYDMIATMATTTFSFLRNQEDMTNHPDVVEEFFYLMERMINYCPDPLITSPLLQSLFQCAAVGMRLDHPGANKGTLKFVETTISYGLALREQNKPDCQNALEHVLTCEGQGIVYNLALAMMGDLPVSSYSSGGGGGNIISEILWKLNLLCPGLLAQWLAAAFASASSSAALSSSSTVSSSHSAATTAVAGGGSIMGGIGGGAGAGISNAPLASFAPPERAKLDFMGALDTGLARDEFSLAARAFQAACERERRFIKMQRS